MGKKTDQITLKRSLKHRIRHTTATTEIRGDTASLAEHDSLSDIYTKTRKQIGVIIEFAKARKLLCNCFFDGVAAIVWWSGCGGKEGLTCY
jgi:hypothetical protein